jgi:uncharacterized Tic20 family protein
VLYSLVIFLVCLLSLSLAGADVSVAWRRGRPIRVRSLCVGITFVFLVIQVVLLVMEGTR